MTAGLKAVNTLRKAEPVDFAATELDFRHGRESISRNWGDLED